MKSRLRVILGLKSFPSAATTIQGVELMRRIRKGQFDLRSLSTQGKQRPKYGQLSLLPELAKDSAESAGP